MFRMAKQREVLWPVTVRVPSGDGSGAVEACEIKLRFRLMTRSEARALAGLSDEEFDAEVRRRITGWEGVCDEEGEPIPFSAEALAAAMDVPYFMAAAHTGLVMASNGAPAKN